MKVLVIGGAGYIGSHVVKALLNDREEKHEITVFDNLSSGLKQNLFKEAAFVEGDILDYPALKKAMEGCGALVHLAAFKAAGESMIVPEKYSVNNITGTLNILNAAAETGLKYFVFSSSAAVYGEPAYLPIDEDHPKNPTNYYGFTKLEIERFLGWYDKLKGIRYAALRYFNAAGYDPEGVVCGLERNPANLLPVVMEVAAGLRPEVKIFGNDYGTPDGTGVRDYVHVTDLADAHVRALHYIVKNNRSLAVNLGSENGISVDEMVTAARKITGQSVPSVYVERRAGDPAKLVASSKKAKEFLKWVPRYSDVDTLVKTTWEAYLKNKK